MNTDPIADLLTRVRNAQRAKHRSVRVRDSKVVRDLLEVLKKEGFIDGVTTVSAKDASAGLPKSKQTAGSYLDVGLRYYESGEPLMGTVDRVSSPGQRVYVGVDSMARVISGLGITIVSTSQGIMSDREAKKKKIGGEVLAKIG